MAKIVKTAFISSVLIPFAEVDGLRMNQKGGQKSKFKLLALYEHSVEAMIKLQVNMPGKTQEEQKKKKAAAEMIENKIDQFDQTQQKILKSLWLIEKIIDIESRKRNPKKHPDWSDKMEKKYWETCRLDLQGLSLKELQELHEDIQHQRNIATVKKNQQAEGKERDRKRDNMRGSIIFHSCVYIGIFLAVCVLLSGDGRMNPNNFIASAILLLLLPLCFAVYKYKNISKMINIIDINAAESDDFPHFFFATYLWLLVCSAYILVYFRI